jgi:CHAT domain-containing protein
MRNHTGFCLFAVIIAISNVGILWAQDLNVDVTLYEQAFQIDLKAKSKQDFEKAFDKYERSQKIFEKVGSLEWQFRALDGMAWIIQLFGDKPRAKDLYSKKLELAEKLGDNPSRSQTLYALGILNMDLANYSEGTAILNDALVSVKKSGDKKAEGAIYSQWGTIYKETGDYPKAVEMFNSSLEIARRNQDAHGEVIDLLNLGRLYMDMGYKDESLKFLTLHVQALTKVGQSMGLDTSPQGIAAIYLAIANYCRGLNANSGTREIRRRFTDVFIEDLCLNTFSLRGPEGNNILYERLGDIGQANATYQWAIDFQRKIGDLAGQSMTLNNMGLVHKIRGDFSKAVECFEQSLEISSKIGAKYGTAVTLSNMANVYVKWGETQKANDLLEQSLVLKKNIGARSSEAYNYIDLGDLKRSLGLHQESLDYYEKGYRLHEQCGQPLAMGDAMIKQGSALISMEQYEKALSKLENGISLVKRAKGHENWPCDIIGNLYLDLGELEKAQQYIVKGGYCSSLARLALAKSDLQTAQVNYESLLQNSDKDGNANNIFIALTGLAMVSEKRGDLLKAQALYEKAMKQTEELRAGLLPSERKNFYDVNIGGFYRSEPAKGLTRVLMKLNQPIKTFHPSETIKARAFADNIAVKYLNDFAGVPKDVLVKEDILTSRVAALRKRLLSLDRATDKTEWQNTVNEIDRAQANLNEFIESLWRNYRPYAQIKYPQPVTLEQSALGPRETTITFDVVGEGVGVKLIKGKELVDFYYIGWTQSDLENDVRRFRRSFDTAKLRDFDVDLGKKLYQKLLDPALAHVPKGTVITLIPDGILSILPFEALAMTGVPEWHKGPAGDFPTGIGYVADNYPIGYHQSLTSLTLARGAINKSKRGGGRLLVMADPVFQLNDKRAQAIDQQVASRPSDEYYKVMAAIENFEGGFFKFDRLPETGALAQNLTQSYKDQTDVFTGVNASKKVFLEEVAPRIDQFDKMVFATHGLFNNRLPGVSGPFLALSMVPPGSDGFLTVADVMALKMNVSIVALTACQTGLGKDQSGEGVMSMGRAFQYAGAESVLMSLWSVAEKSSVLLIESFFKNLKDGRDKITSLEMARKGLREQGFEHPFFWAPFVLVGQIQ